VNTWTTLTNLIPSTNSSVTVSDTQPSARRFYRLKVTPN
jgi:hypothetical protein